MKITKDPRCPAHPWGQVDMGWPARTFGHGNAAACWYCAVCQRKLGKAPIVGLRGQWPDGRRPTVRDMGWMASDLTWVWGVRKSVKRR